ncbi:MAG TPA: DMT family transporter [Gemmatimonadaceae bacterium]|nr:DMT family transporter [Gemmatimonadaceae bacterium]
MTSTTDGTTVPGRAAGAARPGFSMTDLMLLCMSIIWGVNVPLIKYGTSVMHPLAFNGLRVAFAALSLTLIARSFVEVRVSRRELLALVGLGLLGNGLYQILFVEGVAITRAGTAALILASSPAFVALIGHVLGVERITLRGAAGIVLSFAGIALVVLGTTRADGTRSTLLGNALVLAGTFCWSLYTVLLKPYANRLSGPYITAVTMSAGAVPVFLFGLPAMTRIDWGSVPFGAWITIIFSGLGGLVIAYLFWYRGVRVLGPTRTAMYSNLQPVFALLAAWIGLHEVPTLLQGAGAASIIAGVLLTRT